MYKSIWNAEKKIENYDKIVYYFIVGRLNMNRLFVYTETFQKCWKAMGLDDDGLNVLEEQLLADPQKGAVIEGTGGARKLRIQVEYSRGKSGGGRVIYVDVVSADRIYLLFAYPKNVQDNLTSEQKKRIRSIVEQIKKEKSNG